MTLHPHAVTENRSAGDGAGRIDRDDCRTPVAGAQMGHESIDQAALACPGRPGYSHDLGSQPTAFDFGKDFGRGAFSDDRQEPGQRAPITGKRAFEQVEGLGPGGHNPRV